MGLFLLFNFAIFLCVKLKVLEGWCSVDDDATLLELPEPFPVEPYLILDSLTKYTAYIFGVKSKSKVIIALSIRQVAKSIVL